MTAANLVSYSLQLGVLIAVCAALPRAFGLRSPSVQYVFWRVLLAVCLLLPVLQPWRHEEMTFVPAPGAAIPALAGFGQAAPNTGRPFVPFGAVATAAGVLLLAGIGARLAWLGAGVLRLRRVRDKATELATAFADLQQTIGVTADIRWSRHVRHPVTFGTLRPTVLLPGSLRDADESARRAVVAHELHHVRRRDWPVVVAEEVVRSVFWFHPGMWWLVSRVQLARETVVDELSILTTNARRAYLHTLLAFADDTGPAHTPAFSARRHLFHRVMLLSKEGNMSSSKIALASCVLAAALGLGSWAVVHAFPLSMTVVSVAGDQTLPGDQKLPADQSTPPQTRTAPARAQTDETPMPAAFKAALERLHPIRLGNGIPPPAQTTKSVKAEYPEDARAARIQGSVELETIVDTDGKVAAVRVVHSIPGLDDAAVEAAKRWEFAPLLLNGAPTPVLMIMVIKFTLN